MTQNKQVENSLSDVVQGLFSNPLGQANQNFKYDTLRISTSYQLLFNDRQLLSQLYVKHGIIQTLIDQPVDDAFRSGFDIKTDQLSKDEIVQLEVFLDQENVLSKIIQTIKWGRLFGGAGLVVLTNQKSESQLNINAINKYSPLDFYAADLWELNMQYLSASGSRDIKVDNIIASDTPYRLFGEHTIHKSRVLAFKAKEAPSFIRRNFRGWGMSEVERLIASLNSYFKNSSVVFELLDEAKVDVYKIKGLNTALMSPGGSDKVRDRIQLANMIKNYLNAITMDAEDTYEQKQMTFTGLSEMLKQIREGVASDVKMPVTKLFGVSSAGFNSGEDDIENYNSMVESEVRYKAKHIILQTLRICCKKLFDIVPDDLRIEFKPLRILSSEQEEIVKTSKLNRILMSQSQGLISASEAKQAINKASLLPIEIEESDEVFEDLFGEKEVQTLQAKEK